MNLTLSTALSTTLIKALRATLRIMCSVCLYFSVIGAINAATIDDLIANNKLTIDLRISKTENIIAKEQITLSIDVATDRWFAKGITIDSFTMVEAIVLPLTGQTINGTKKVNYKTWVTQTREIILYPNQAGIYEIPAIAVKMAINTEQGPVSGIAYTKVAELDVIVPAKLKGISDYVVSNNVTVKVEYEGEVESATTEEDEQQAEPIYKIGSAITQTISFSAENVPAMMFPQIEQPEINGISIYHKPGQINDTNNRGMITGKRSDSFSFIFEQAGTYHLPERNFFWFNTASQQLEEITIPGQTWQVSTEVVDGHSSIGISPTWKFDKGLILQFIALLISLYLIFRLYRYRTKLFNLYKRVSRQQYRQYKQRYLQAIKEQDYKLAIGQLYLLTSEFQRSGALKPETPAHKEQIEQRLKLFYSKEPLQLQLIEKLMEMGFGVSKTTFTLEQAQQLLKIKKRKSTKNNDLKLTDKIQLNSRD